MGCIFSDMYSFLFTCRESTEIPFDPSIVSLAHFEIQRVLGKGGFGKVNAVVKLTNPNKGRWYAMKTIQKHLLVKSKNREKLRNNIFAERNILATIQHPFIYAFQDETFLYLIMDVALGGDLLYQLQKTPDGFPEERAKFYIAQSIIALEYLHDLQIIHRDIKPANMLMDECGYIKLSDFGLSRKLSNGVCTEGGGTRTYIAPELYRSHNHLHSIPADWFSIGVTLFEFITQKRPFNEETIKKKKYESERRCRHKKKYLKYWKFKGCDHVSDNCKLFIQSLLIFNPEYRLGTKGIDEIKKHPWFDGFEWESLLQFKYSNVPFVPDLSKANVNGNADIDACLDSSNAEPIPAHLQAMFNGYEYNVEIPPSQQDLTFVPQSKKEKEKQRKQKKQSYGKITPLPPPPQIKINTNNLNNNPNIITPPHTPHLTNKSVNSMHSRLDTLRQHAREDKLDSVSYLGPTQEEYDDEDMNSDESTRDIGGLGSEMVDDDSDDEKKEEEHNYEHESSKKQMKVVMSQPGVICLRTYGSTKTNDTHSTTARTGNASDNSDINKLINNEVDEDEDKSPDLG